MQLNCARSQTPSSTLIGATGYDFRCAFRDISRSHDFVSRDLIGQWSQTRYSWKLMALTYSMNGPFEMPNWRFDVINQIGLMVAQWHPKRSVAQFTPLYTMCPITYASVHAWFQTYFTAFWSSDWTAIFPILGKPWWGYNIPYHWSSNNTDAEADWWSVLHQWWVVILFWRKFIAEERSTALEIMTTVCIIKIEYHFFHQVVSRKTRRQYSKTYKCQNKC